jgi:cytochrome c556
VPSVAENLQTAKESIAAKLAAAAAAVGPSYSVDGQSVDRVAYMRSLREEMEAINALLTQEEPFEIRSEFG